jgi:hypothetical protein
VLRFLVRETGQRHRDTKIREWHSDISALKILTYCFKTLYPEFIEGLIFMSNA